MNCWHCDGEMIWGGDHSFEECGYEGDGIISNFSCPSCPAMAFVHLPFGEEEDGDDNG
tara:strand:+ start:420 stop:593 length:174 start_codon:yes stop_codon:yes gene_type:complete